MSTVTSGRRPVSLSDLGPIAQLRAGKLGRRLPQLLVGLTLYGISIAMMVQSSLGLAPWDVLHSGLTGWVPFSIGEVLVAVSFLVLLLWIPLRERPGLGTLLNAIQIGVVVDLTIHLLPEPDAWTLRFALLVAGVLLNGLATALYIGAQFGRGPRDGLMTGLARRTGWSLRLVRTGLEISVVLVGVTLGGVLGLGTIVYALAIGPLAQAMLPWCTVDLSGE